MHNICAARTAHHATAPFLKLAACIHSQPPQCAWAFCSQPGGCVVVAQVADCWTRKPKAFTCRMSAEGAQGQTGRGNGAHCQVHLPKAAENSRESKTRQGRLAHAAEIVRFASPGLRALATAGLSVAKFNAGRQQAQRSRRTDQIASAACSAASQLPRAAGQALLQQLSHRCFACRAVQLLLACRRRPLEHRFSCAVCLVAAGCWRVS